MSMPRLKEIKPCPARDINKGHEYRWATQNVRRQQYIGTAVEQDGWYYCIHCLQKEVK